MRHWGSTAMLAFSLTAPTVAVATPTVAANRVIARDSHISGIYVLGGTMAYQRSATRTRPARRAWMRRVNGRLLRAIGIPAGAEPSAIGRDRSGRVVLTMSIAHTRNHLVVSRDWWIYDVASDRARRLFDVPVGACAPTAVSVWRTRLAYASCKPGSGPGVFLREGGRTRRLSRGLSEFQPLALRGGMLAAVIEEGNSDSAVWRLLEDGKACRTRIAGSYLPEEWLNRGVWFGGHTLIWGSGSNFDHDPGWLTGARLAGRCGHPGATGAIAPAPPLPDKSRARAVDGRWLYYADDHAIYRQRLTAPQVDPPANDDFEAATPLAGNVPISLTQTIGNATTQPGDPTKDSVWYAFRPTRTQWVRVRSVPEFSVSVFEGGTDIRALVELNPPALVLEDSGPVFSAAGGQTYWLAIACTRFRDYHFDCYMPFDLKLTAAQPPAPETSTGGPPGSTG